MRTFQQASERKQKIYLWPIYKDGFKSAVQSRRKFQEKSTRNLDNAIQVLNATHNYSVIPTLPKCGADPWVRYAMSTTKNYEFVRDYFYGALKVLEEHDYFRYKEVFATPPAGINEGELEEPPIAHLAVKRAQGETAWDKYLTHFLEEIGVSKEKLCLEGVSTERLCLDLNPEKHWEKMGNNKIFIEQLKRWANFVISQESSARKHDGNMSKAIEYVTTGLKEYQKRLNLKPGNADISLFNTKLNMQDFIRKSERTYNTGNASDL